MKKFLCYDTNDAASGKIGVNSNGVLKPNSTVPSTNGASYQQLVTDGKGEVRWEDRLAYEHTEWRDFTLSSGEGTEITGFTMPPVGDTITVKVNGVESVETVKSGEIEGQSYSYIGSIDMAGLFSGTEGWCISNPGVIPNSSGFAVPVTTVSLFITIPPKIKYEYLPDDLLKSPYPIQIVDFDIFLRSFGFKVSVISGDEGTYNFSLPKEKWDEFIDYLDRFNAKNALCLSYLHVVYGVRSNGGIPNFYSVETLFDDRNNVYVKQYQLDVSYNEETEKVTVIKSIITKKLT